MLKQGHYFNCVRLKLAFQKLPTCLDHKISACMVIRVKFISCGFVVCVRVVCCLSDVAPCKIQSSVN